MGHIRKVCRKNIVGLLEEISSSIKVFESRVHTLDRSDLPCIVVKSGSQLLEDLTPSRSQPRMQKRIIETEVYCFVRAADGIEDEIDDMALQIEKAISKDPTLSGKVISTSLDSTSSYLSEEPNSPIGAMRMSYISIAHTLETDPDKSIRN